MNKYKKFLLIGAAFLLFYLGLSFYGDYEDSKSMRTVPTEQHEEDANSFLPALDLEPPVVPGIEDVQYLVTSEGWFYYSSAESPPVDAGNGKRLLL